MPDQTPITTLIFDLSEVLIMGLLDIDKPLADQLGIPLDGLFTAFGGPSLNDLFCGRITEDAYLSQIIEKEKWEVSLQQFKTIIRQKFHRKVPGMEQMVSSLAPKYDLVLLSDHAEEWIADIIEFHPFLGIFKRQFYSFQLQQTKSDPSTFTRVLLAIRKQPEECLFIDDWSRNIASAEKAGVRGIQFLGAEDLARGLAVMGITVGVSR